MGPLMRDVPVPPRHGPQAAIRVTLVRNTAWNYIGFGVNLLTNVLAFPIVVRHLGDAAAGIWLLLGSVTGYMGLLHLGIVPALAQFVAAGVAAGDVDSVNRRASTSLALLLGAGVIPLALVPFAPTLAAIFQVPDTLRAQAAQALSLGLIGFTLQVPGHVFNAVLNGAQRQDRCSQVWILSNALKATGTIALAVSGYGLVALLYFDVALIIVVGVTLGVVAVRTVPALRLSPRFVHLSDARELAGFGGLLVIGTLSALAVEQTDRLIIGALLPVAMVTYYAAAWKIYMLAFALPTTLLSAVAPMAGALFGTGETDRLRRLFLQASKYGVAATWPVALSLAGTAAILLRAWMGPGFEAHDRVVHVLLAALVVKAHNHAAIAVLTGMRRIRHVTWAYSLPQAVLNIGFSIWLVSEFGIIGAALGTLIPIVLLEYVFLDHVLAVLGVSWTRFLQVVVIPTAIPALVCFVPLGVGVVMLGALHPALIATAAVCAAGYAAWFWRHSLEPAERSQFWSLAPAGVRRGG